MTPDVFAPASACTRISLTGQSIDLLRPSAADVDFAEIANVLATLNAYAGNATKPVSIAQQVLIGCDAAPVELMPWVLLRHAHKARLGDVTVETVRAVATLAGRVRLGGDSAVIDAMRHLVELHDIAIHSAAGLAMPNAAQRQALLDIDQIVEATLRRDFLPKPRGARQPNRNALPRVYRLRSAVDLADALFHQFQIHLPSQRAASCRSVHS